jgi:DNA polymerase-3 subunit delta
MSDLSAGKIPRVIAIGGEARVLVDDALTTLRKLVLAGGLADFNHDRLSAKQGAEGIVTAAETFPVMAPLRLVEVENADALGEEGLRVLDPYLEKPCETTVLVLKLDHVDLRQKLGKALEKKTTLVRCEHPRERDMPDLVRVRARKFGVTLDEEVALTIALSTGTDLGLVDRALEKLALVCAERAVSIADVSEHVADTHMEDAFAFGGAVARADRRAALQSLAALEKNRAAPLQLVGLVAWQLRQVVKAREMLDDGAGARDVKEALRAFGDRGDVLIAAARRFDLRAHKRRLGRLGAIDQALKSSRAKDNLWLERLVLELCPLEREGALAPRTSAR